MSLEQRLSEVLATATPTTTTKGNTMNNHQLNLNSCSVLVTLGVSQWTARKLDRGVSDEVEASKGAKSKGAARVNKNLLAGRPELEDIAKIATRMRNYVYDNTFPWTDAGQRLLPTLKLMDFDKNIRLLMAEFNAQVEAFIAIYPGLITAQAMALGAMFKRDDFPSASEIAAKFNVSLDIEPVPSTGDFRVDVGNDALAELQASLTRTNSSREAAMLADITKRVSDHLERMADRLVSETDLKTGDFKQKRFHDTLVTNAYDLCSLVKSLPALQGHAIDKAAAALEKALGGTTAQTLRDDYAKREDVRKAVNELRNQFDL
jgi:hypothetical protein